MRLILSILLLTAFSFGCQTEISEKEMKQDASTLVKMEKEIVSLAVEFNETNDSTLTRKQDSLGRILQQKSLDLQEKYEKVGKIKSFQKIYDQKKKAAYK
ncbi:MAG: hypothetical protein PF489_15645 [Salinivirgaceae bacterium]|jgi:hypothetical protein|nr:hypothetical protein [Salinivirgaceae bacterium]